jgi:hypothetical protein
VAQYPLLVQVVVLVHLTELAQLELVVLAVAVMVQRVAQAAAVQETKAVIHQSKVTVAQGVQAATFKAVVAVVLVQLFRVAMVELVQLLHC